MNKNDKCLKLCIIDGAFKFIFFLLYFLFFLNQCKQHCDYLAVRLNANVIGLYRQELI